MALKDLDDWIEEHKQTAPYWVAKRLSSNDTGLTGGHQGGPLIVKSALFRLFPRLAAPTPSVTEDHFLLRVDSHAGQTVRARAVWYKSKGEGRFTNLGGQKSALLDLDNTGGLVVFAFKFDAQSNVSESTVWICRDPDEEAKIEALTGAVEPRESVIWENSAIGAHSYVTRRERHARCWLSRDEIPPAWLVKFPSGQQILEKVIERRPTSGRADALLMQRRRCEYEMFQSIEEATFLPRLIGGFESVKDFTSLAQSVLQSRKSRAGNSLEFHVRQIFQENSLIKDRNFSHKPKIDGNPDFIFPSQSAYSDAEFPVSDLRMLAAKTTCKDRWRQVTKEAKRLTERHLITLQEGVTESQFEEMVDSNVRLVVPNELHKAYPPGVRPKLISFESFIKQISKLPPHR